MFILTTYITHFFGVSNTNTIQFPTTGNLLLVESAFPQSQNQITAFSSSPANTWTYYADATRLQPQIEFATNASSSTSMTFLPTVNKASVGTLTVVAYDVSGLLPASFDSTAGYFTNAVTTSTQTATFTNMPASVPTTNGIVFVCMPNGTGPVTNCTTAGWILDSVTYGGQSDNDTMDNSDGYAHTFNTSGGTNSVGWSMNSNPIGDLPQGSFALGFCFKAAVSPGN